MSRVATTERLVAPADAAALIYAAGIGLSAIETDEGLTRHLADALIRERIRLGRAPNDLAAVRQEMRRLWGEHERAGRRRECARYATPSQRT